MNSPRHLEDLTREGGQPYKNGAYDPQNRKEKPGHAPRPNGVSNLRNIQKEG